MRVRTGAAVAGGVLAALLAGCNSNAASEQRNTGQGFQIEVIAEGFEHPWGLAFLDSERALVTERPGRLSLVDLTSGERQPIEGLPPIAAENQGGLLDVALHPDFEANPWVYLTYSAAGDGGLATHVARGRLDGERLTDFEQLHVATPFLRGGQHFGSRMVFDRDGYLFVTVGDRGQRERSQQLDNHQGVTLRLTTDGEVPEDNPFVGQEGAEPAIYSYGHRNAQGMAVHPVTGRIWQHEHGPRGGDELNLLEPGANYGWPLASFGREYSDGSPIGPDPDQMEGTVPPIYYWQDSLAPSGLTFYDGEAFPAWQGDLFMGSLSRRQLLRLTLEGERVVDEEVLLADQGWRIRDVRSGPDGYLYLLVDSGDAPLVRLVPAE